VWCARSVRLRASGRGTTTLNGSSRLSEAATNWAAIPSVRGCAETPASVPIELPSSPLENSRCVVRLEAQALRAPECIRNYRRSRDWCWRQPGCWFRPVGVRGRWRSRSLARSDFMQPDRPTSCSWD
jgi:hypothetical protein